MGLLQPFAPPSAGKETAPGARKMWTDVEKQQPGKAEPGRTDEQVREEISRTQPHINTFGGPLHTGWETEHPFPQQNTCFSALTALMAVQPERVLGLWSRI